MRYYKQIFVGLLMLLWKLPTFAQKATMAPKGDHKPVDFSQIENIVILIILPLVFLGLYFVWKSKVRKDREQSRNLNK